VQERSAKGAEDVIAGYTCVNDLSNRDDDQRQEQNWVRGKPSTTPAPSVRLLRRRSTSPRTPLSSLASMARPASPPLATSLSSIPELIEEITNYMTLEPGDVISTGTPSGVGPLENGDRVEIEVEGVGTLSHTVRIP